jgi:hypothetical protein
MCATQGLGFRSVAVAHIVQSVYREQSARCVPPKALEFDGGTHRAVSND